MSLVFLVMGALMLIVTVIATLMPALRLMEDRIPDANEAPMLT
jgi:hypothetical protein